MGGGLLPWCGPRAAPSASHPPLPEVRLGKSLLGALHCGGGEGGGLALAPTEESPHGDLPRDHPAAAPGSRLRSRVSQANLRKLRRGAPLACGLALHRGLHGQGRGRHRLLVGADAETLTSAFGAVARFPMLAPAEGRPSAVSGAAHCPASARGRRTGPMCDAPEDACRAWCTLQRVLKTSCCEVLHISYHVQ